MRAARPVALAVWGLLAAPLAAQPPHLDFVRGLQKNGHPDLALEYLHSLAKQRIPSDLLRILPLEIASVRQELALRENDPHRRSQLFKQAREDFRGYVAQNAATRTAVDAEFQMARISVVLGKTLLDQAQQIERVTARRSILSQARTHLDEAVKEFRSVISSVEKHLATETLSATERKEVADISSRAELEQAISLIWTYVAFDEALAPAKVELGRQASTTLKRIASRDPKQPIAWEARAWLGRFHLEAQDYRAAKKEIQAVIDQSDAAALEGKRCARYVRLLLLEHDSEVKDASRMKLKEAEQWLGDYKEYANTADGLSVRFHLAEAQLEQSKKRAKTESLRLLAEAERSFGIVENSPSEFARTARERKLATIYLRSAERTKGEISQLKDFPECWLRAQVEIYQRNQESIEPSKKLDPDEREKLRIQRRGNIARALERALELADSTTPPAERDEAHYTLAYLRLTELNDPYGAAVLGEALARRDPSSPRAAAGAGCAVEAYTQLLAATASQGGTHGADKERLRRLAVHMEATWPTDQATDHARFCVAQLALSESNFSEAIQLLRRITPMYASYGLSQFRIAQTALQAHKRNETPPEDQPPYREQAMAALAAIPEVTVGTDAGTVTVYFQGKVELARLLFANKQYDELARVSDQLSKTFRAFKPTLEEAIVTEIEPLIDALPAYAKCGQADVHFRAGRHDEVLRLLEPFGKQVRGAKSLELQDPRLVRLILSLALWSHVQKENRSEAADILKTLLQEKSASRLESVGAVVTELLAQLRGQMDELRGKDNAERLRKATENANKFLDATAAGAANLEFAEMVRFLAFGYSILENHAAAADLLGKMTLRARDNRAGNSEEGQTFQSLQIMHARELRLARRFDESRDKLREILRADWGKNNVAARKELVTLWEDKGDYAAAAQGWNELMSSIRPSIEQNARSKDLYFECYYRVISCLCKSAAASADIRKKNEDIHKAANWYVKLRKHREDMGGPELSARYRALQQSTPEFKKACDELLRNAK